MLDPVCIAAIGTILVIGSVLVTGPYISRKERKIDTLEAEVTAMDRLLSGRHEALQRSYSHFLPSEIKLLILQTSGKSEIQKRHLLEVSRGILQGILERQVAATGEGPSQERFKEIEKIALRAGNGEAEAFNELSEISANLLAQWANKHKSTGLKRDAKKEEVAKIKHKIDFWRSFAIFLQILGLIAVLLKDISGQ